MNLPSRRTCSPSAGVVLSWPIAVFLSACSGRDNDDKDRTQAGRADIGDVRQAPGVTVFASDVSFRLANDGDLLHRAPARHGVEAAGGQHRARLAGSARQLRRQRQAPVASRGRTVRRLYQPGVHDGSFRDGSKHSWQIDIAAGAHAGPADVYAQPVIGVGRAADSAPGFDFIHIKNGRTSPVVIDTDGHLRWTGVLPSSRENFVVKLDYETGAIRWLFGDTSKHWYVNDPSLRALALRLEAGKAPIGQHSLSVLPNGELLLFNNGLGSLNTPPGVPPGVTRSYSMPSRYAIDKKAGTAREVWSDERERILFSDICSSVYEGSPGNYLVACSALNARTSARLPGVDNAGRVAFDFTYPAMACDTVFIAQPLGWADLKLR